MGTVYSRPFTVAVLSMLVLISLLLACAGCTPHTPAVQAPDQLASPSPPGRAEEMLVVVVDCLLPSREKKLGSLTYLEARRPIKTSPQDCKVRGGEYRNTKKTVSVPESTQNTVGKYRSVDSFGLKHFAYLMIVKRQIELAFSIPYFQPESAIGVPIVGFTIRRDGELVEVVLLRSSDYPVVDRALLDAVRGAAPYVPFPEDLTDKEISIRVFATVSEAKK